MAEEAEQGLPEDQQAISPRADCLGKILLYGGVPLAVLSGVAFLFVGAGYLAMCTEPRSNCDPFLKDVCTISGPVFGGSILLSLLGYFIRYGAYARLEQWCHGEESSAGSSAAESGTQQPPSRHRLWCCSRQLNGEQQPLLGSANSATGEEVAELNCVAKFLRRCCGGRR